MALLFGDCEFTVLVIKFVCVVGLAAVLFIYACWKLYRHEERVVPVREKEKWEIAFENWLREHGNRGLHRL